MHPLPLPMTLALTIERLPDRERSLHLTLSRDGHPSASHRVFQHACLPLFALVDGFRQLFKPGREAVFARSEPQTGESPRCLLMHSLGVELFHLWLAPFWSGVEKDLASGRPLRLTIVANAPEILNIPWELLRWPDGQVLGVDPRLTLWRRPMGGGGDRGVGGGEPTSGELRVLFAASMPEGCHWAADRGSLFPDFIREKNAPSSACPQLPAATRVALRRRLQEERPSWLCLTGPVLISGEQGFFGFEDGQGEADICSAGEMARELCAGSGLSLVVIAGREENRPPPVAAVAAICQGLVAQGVAQALAWPGVWTDPFSSDFLRAFLHYSREGAPVDQALRAARWAILPACEQAEYPAWALPVLYTRSGPALSSTPV